MNELEKCMAGKWYDCHDEIFLEYKSCLEAWGATYRSDSHSYAITEGIYILYR